MDYQKAWLKLKDEINNSKGYIKTAKPTENITVDKNIAMAEICDSVLKIMSNIENELKCEKVEDVEIKELNFIEMCNMPSYSEFKEKYTGEIVYLDNDLVPRWKGDKKPLPTYNWTINSKYIPIK